MTGTGTKKVFHGLKENLKYCFEPSGGLKKKRLTLVELCVQRLYLLR